MSKYISIVGFEEHYEPKKKGSSIRSENPSYMKIPERILYGPELSKLSRSQTCAYFALVWLGVKHKNALHFDLNWIKRRSFCKMTQSDIELFQQLNLISVHDSEKLDSNDKNRLDKIRLEEIRLDKNRGEESEERRLETAKSFFSATNPKSEKPISEDEIKAFKENLGIDVGKFQALVKSVGVE